jgi:hyperosmotically inducible protein
MIQIDFPESGTASKTKSKNEKTSMKKTSANTCKSLKVLALIACLALPLAGGLAGCAGDRYNQSTGQRLDDNRTAERVKDALAHDPQYKYDGVNVVAFKGVVQLSGFVNTKAQKSSAGDVAKKVEGVREVENNITVKETVSKLN